MTLEWLIVSAIHHHLDMLCWSQYKRSTAYIYHQQHDWSIDNSQSLNVLNRKIRVTTPQFAPLGDMKVVPTRWSPIVAIFLTMLSISASVVTFVSGAQMMLRKIGAPEYMIAALTVSRTATISNSVVKIAESIIMEWTIWSNVSPEKVFWFLQKVHERLDVEWLTRWRTDEEDIS